MMRLNMDVCSRCLRCVLQQMDKHKIDVQVLILAAKIRCLYEIYAVIGTVWVDAKAMV